MKLHPCPYCGNKDVVLATCPGGLYSVVCPLYACTRLMARLYFSKADALKGWAEECKEELNRRAKNEH